MRLHDPRGTELISRTYGAQISKKHRRVTVIDQVSFVIRQSQLCAILREEGQCGRQLISIGAVGLR